MAEVNTNPNEPLLPPSKRTPDQISPEDEQHQSTFPKKHKPQNNNSETLISESLNSEAPNSETPKTEALDQANQKEQQPEEEEEAEEEDDNANNGEVVIDRKGKGILIEDEEDDDDDSDDDSDSDDSNVGGDLSGEDSDFVEDPLAEVDLDNILPSRTRRKSIQPGAYIANDLPEEDDEDESDDPDA